MTGHLRGGNGSMGIRQHLEESRSLSHSDLFFESLVFSDSNLCLVLWNTMYFRPIMDHVELEPILSNLGFVGLPPYPAHPLITASLSWREYEYQNTALWRRRLREGQEPPRLRLPYPAIDGLHISTYKMFISAVEFFLGRDVSDIFHLGNISLERASRGSFLRLKMEEGQTSCISLYYRRGTVDVAGISQYNRERERAQTEGEAGDHGLLVQSPRSPRT
ncbi:hypothetical protein SAY87_011350 [Trapa incisa]|uniref:Uncharacterized protein n=1 Tax=Trapa incisa TaxID=236973 RepID=A0AAN7GQP4_9MYRT|nr:hypothetical protein SAY87_011350 [Trapa incisa]